METPFKTILTEWKLSANTNHFLAVYDLATFVKISIVCQDIPRISGKDSFRYSCFHVLAHVLLMAVSVCDQHITITFPRHALIDFSFFFCKVLPIDLTFAVRVQNEVFYKQDPTLLYMRP